MIRRALKSLDPFTPMYEAERRKDMRCGTCRFYTAGRGGPGMCELMGGVTSSYLCLEWQAKQTTGEG